MIRIPLRRRDGSLAGTALVDDEDLEVAGVRWHMSGPGYAVRSIGGGRKEYMHRRLLGLVAADRSEVDHVNGDRLDNRRSNLRVVTHAENLQNRPSPKGAASPHRGVSWNGTRRKWRASVGLPTGERRQLGEFENELDAARAAAEFRRQHLPFANPARDVLPPEVEESEPKEIAA